MEEHEELFDQLNPFVYYDFGVALTHESQRMIMRKIYHLWLWSTNSELIACELIEPSFAVGRRVLFLHLARLGPVSG
jgi:hypothetical protein